MSKLACKLELASYLSCRISATE